MSGRPNHLTVQEVDAFIQRIKEAVALAAQTVALAEVFGKTPLAGLTAALAPKAPAPKPSAPKAAKKAPARKAAKAKRAKAKPAKAKPAPAAKTGAPAAGPGAPAAKVASKGKRPHRKYLPGIPVEKVAQVLLTAPANGFSLADVAAKLNEPYKDRVAVALRKLRDTKKARVVGERGNARWFAAAAG